MKRALLFTGGEAARASVIRKRLREFSYICAADSGLDAADALGIVPDLVVGDMDSLKNQALLEQCGAVRIFPRDKDYSDTELGIRELFGLGYSRITLAGGGGGRLDHLLALRALFERSLSPEEWIGPNEVLIKITAPACFSIQTEANLSLFPLSGGAVGMKSNGLVWPLDGLIWDAGSYGLSNRASSNKISIDPGERPIILVAAHETELSPA